MSESCGVCRRHGHTDPGIVHNHCEWSDGVGEPCARPVVFGARLCNTHHNSCRLVENARAAARAQVMVLEERAEQRIREIVREEIQAALRERDTIPAPTGDSWSGADVVPRGSSRPPGFVVQVNTATGRAVADAVLDLTGACTRCRMLACVCWHREYPNPDNGHGAADGFGGSDYPDVVLFDNNEGGSEK
jgi:hypothetical protein